MLPSIKAIIDIYKLQPNKKLGQNFLMDQTITDTIVTAAGKLDDREILEVGPGPGLLSRSILESAAAKLHAVEFDPRCIEALGSLADKYGERFNLIQADAMGFDFANLTESKLTVIANLPYNIGTQLILRWLETPQKYQTIVVMLQKEVVDRITAKPGGKSFGRLAVICQMLCDVEVLMDIDRTCFYPPPKVQSAVVKLTPLASPRFKCNIKVLQRVTAAAFGMRRKMLRQSLKSILGSDIEKLESLGISLTERAEHLTLEQFAQITNLVTGDV